MKLGIQWTKLYFKGCMRPGSLSIVEVYLQGLRSAVGRMWGLPLKT